MADGKTHMIISLLAAPVVGLMVSDWTRDIDSGICFAAGCLLGIVLSPDLDQEQRTISEAVMYKLPIIGFLFQVYFYPYALFFKHRSPFTHLPGIGTIIRLVYLFIPTICLTAWLFPFMLGKIATFGGLRWLAIWIFAGLFVSDGLHWIADGLPV